MNVHTVAFFFLLEVCNSPSGAIIQEDRISNPLRQGADGFLSVKNTINGV